MTKRQEFIDGLTDNCITQFEDDAKAGRLKGEAERNSVFQSLMADAIDAVYKAYGTVMKAYSEGDYGL